MLILNLVFLLCLSFHLLAFSVVLNDSDPRSFVSVKKKKKIRLHHPNLHVENHGTQSNHYGVDLPAFAFDYSELFVNAVIERVEGSRDLFLTVFLLPREKTRRTGSVRAVSTDHHSIFSWTRALPLWTAESDRGRLAKVFCVLQNNEGSGPSLPYQSPAYWLARWEAEGTNKEGKHERHNMVEAVRCKLRGTSSIYSNATFSSDRRLFVDLMRRQSANISSSGSGSGKSIEQTLLISLSVPWNSRQIGYSQEVSLSSLSAGTARDGKVTTEGRGGEGGGEKGEKQRSQSMTKIHACIPGIRPVKGRPHVGSAMLIELVQHLLLQDVLHITLGVVLEKDSYFWDKLVHLLGPLLASGRVALVPLALPQFDDVPGFAGLWLSDSLIDSFFLNHCFYASKGLSDYVLVMKPNQLLIPMPEGRSLATALRQAALNSSLPLSSLYWGKYLKSAEDEEAFLSAMGSSESHDADYWARRNASIQNMFARSRAKAKFYHQGSTSHRERRKEVAAKQDYRRLASDLNESSTVTSSPEKAVHHVTCSIAVETNFDVNDPESALFGPDDFSYSKDYFASSPLLELSYNRHVVHFLSTYQALGVEVSEVGEVRPICRAHGNPYDHSVRRVVSVQKVLSKQYLYSLSFLEASPGSARRIANVSFAVEAEDRRRAFLSSIHDDLLNSYSMRNSSSLQRLARAFTQAYRQSHPDGRFVVKGQQALTEPFWKTCQQRPLAAVVQGIFS
eukprot:gene9794-10831_t